MALFDLKRLLSLHQRGGASVRAQENTARKPTDEKITATPEIPKSSLFKGLSEHVTASSIALPTIAQCAVHLELLQAFWALRRKIESSTDLDHVLDIKPEKRTVYRRNYSNYSGNREPVELKDENFGKRRASKWPFYLAIAAARFLQWVDVVEKSLTKGEELHLPPLDVLMVWHTLLLNTKWLQRFGQYPLTSLKTIPFPWHKIHEAVQAGDEQTPFALHKTDGSWYENNLGQSADLLDFIASKEKSECVSQLLRKFRKNAEGEKARRCLTETQVREAQADATGLLPLETAFLRACFLANDQSATTDSLVDAVQRQATFVNKMERQLWIRSPAAEGTLSRAINRYDKFLKLFRLHPGTILVPTLDIDLVWHTHQCSPQEYERATKAIAGRFINHDDTLATGTLDTGMETTAKLFRMRFAEEYQACHCWDCETLLSATEDAGKEVDAEAIAREVQSILHHYRELEIARRNRCQLPAPPSG